jgi:hypothetical protein
MLPVNDMGQKNDRHSWEVFHDSLVSLKELCKNWIAKVGRLYPCQSGLPSRGLARDVHYYGGRLLSINAWPALVYLATACL